MAKSPFTSIDDFPLITSSEMVINGKSMDFVFMVNGFSIHGVSISPFNTNHELTRGKPPCAMAETPAPRVFSTAAPVHWVPQGPVPAWRNQRPPV